MSREHMNPLFKFLRPSHSLFAFFTELKDAYARVIKPPDELLDKLQSMRFVPKMLDRCLHRVEWNRQEV